MRWQILSKKGSKNLIQLLLVNRGLQTKKDQENFLNPKNPHKLTPRDVGVSQNEIKKAITRLKRAIKNKERIIVYGDYDTDGICATAIMWEALHKLGANVMPFIPKRQEGYGMKVKALDKMAKDGVKLIVTVDQGIVHGEQVEHCHKIGLEVIITDHHVPGKKKPKALAVIHTTKMAGAGVAWFFAKHLRGVVENSTPPSEVARQRPRLLRGENDLDLVTIGTVTDMVPLLGPNRSIVKYGLEEVKKTKRPGLLALYKLAGIDRRQIGVYEVGFIIGPRLNAAGRLDDPIESLRLVCTKDKPRAQDLAVKINERNSQRQALTEQTTVHARELWLKQDGQSKLIFVSDKSYQEGIVGLVAAKLMEEFYRPAVVISQQGEWSKASARSIDGFNIVEAIRLCADILGSHGGHARAAGFSVETKHLEILRERLISLADKKLDREKLSPTLKIDAEIDLDQVNFSLYKEIEKLSPFGMDNPQPVFATRNVEVIEAKAVGADGRHLKLRLAAHTSRLTFDAIGFGLGYWFPKLAPGKPINIAFNLAVDEWNGHKRLQLRLRDVKLSENK